jgi:flagellar motor switch protein FliM
MAAIQIADMAQTASNALPTHQRNREIIRGKIEKTIDRYERYPLLDVIWTQFTRRLVQRLAAVYGVSVEAQIISKDIQRFRTCLDDLPHPALLCVFEALEWQDSGLVVLDGGIAEANLEFLLGGDQGAPFEPEMRTTTHLDRALARRLVDAALAELTRSFSASRSEIGPVTLACSHIETSPQFAAITGEQGLVFVVRLHLDIGDTGRSGQIGVVIPVPMPEPIRRYLIEAYRGEQKANDLVWTRHITGALLELPLPFEVELERTVSAVRAGGVLAGGRCAGTVGGSEFAAGNAHSRRCRADHDLARQPGGDAWQPGGAVAWRPGQRFWRAIDAAGTATGRRAAAGGVCAAIGGDGGEW